MSTEASCCVGDTPPVAQLVECTPDEPATRTDKTELPEPPDSTPAIVSAEATIENTGADPPPARED